MTLEVIHYPPQPIQLTSKRLILFDSCIYIMDKNKAGNVLTVLGKKLRKYRLQNVVPIIVLNEISKVTKSNFNENVKNIERKLGNFVISEITDDIIVEEKKLEEKYLECHWPDSIILATAKIHGSILVTLDTKLLRSAQLEGVDAYHLSDFMKFWRIQVDY